MPLMLEVSKLIWHAQTIFQHWIFFEVNLINRPIVFCYRFWAENIFLEPLLSIEIVTNRSMEFYRLHNCCIIGKQQCNFRLLDDLSIFNAWKSLYKKSWTEIGAIFSSELENHTCKVVITIKNKIEKYWSEDHFFFWWAWKSY